MCVSVCACVAVYACVERVDPSRQGDDDEGSTVGLQLAVDPGMRHGSGVPAEAGVTRGC